jgi:hypothetical protein
MKELEDIEQKLHEATVELMKKTERNVHIEINAEHNSESVKITTNFNRTFKGN